MFQIKVRTQDQEEFVEITDRVERFVAGQSKTEGVCFVYCEHTTAGLTINENADPDVRHDMLHALDQIVRQRDPAYRHAEGNSAAHVKASLMGASVAIPFTAGRLILGRWQGIYLCEFDGPRMRCVSVFVH